MKGTIYIIGQIGNTYNQDGSIETKGVTVADVATQFAVQSECGAFDVIINSPGGSVNEGDEISKILSGMKNIFTIASGQCMSIATKIFTSVPVENRSIESTCQFMIHNPLFTNISGNAAELKYAAGVLEPLEKELANHYAKATGLSKTLLAPLMNAESVLSPTECVDLGFAGSVVEPKLKAVAFYDANFNNQSNMKKVSEIMAAVKAKAVALGFVGENPNPDAQGAGGQGGEQPGADARNAVALVMESDQGTIETPFEDIMVGDPVVMQESGEAAADGAYVLNDGTTINVMGGAVESIMPVEGGDLQAIIVAKDAELDAMKVTIGELETALVQASFAIEKLEAKAVRSTHKPNSGAVATYRPLVGASKTPAGITKDSLSARRQELKSNKK